MWLDRVHFRAGDLLFALGDGFDDDDRRRALRHFGGGCPVCWRRLEELEVTAGPDASRDYVARWAARSPCCAAASSSRL